MQEQNITANRERKFQLVELKNELKEKNFMEYGIIVLMIIGGILLYIKINELQKQVKSQQIQIDKLCKETGNQ